ncbi:MAG: 4Fe-4S ferredoxin [Planctomycetota bacterium]|nr:MAG: 4Fe-4S ferredoxin [Planctomycetota bacterium]
MHPKERLETSLQSPVSSSTGVAASHQKVAELVEIALQCGADDAAVVPVDHPALNRHGEEIQKHFPKAKSLLALVLKMNREPIRHPARSVANLEFHHVGDDANTVARQVVRELQQRGVYAVNPAMAFPMEMDRWPDKMWLVEHKRVAEAAGLGKMGIHRNVIHPKFGNFILLATVVVGEALPASGNPLTWNPCLECKLCVAACPVGAVKPDGAFDFSACYTHNYREFMGGFSDWVENVASSSSGRNYRRKHSDSETVSLWQSLSFGPNYKAAYCLAVCPAGEEVLPPFQTDRKQFVGETLRPLQAKKETLYVLKGSDAENYARKKFPHKKTKRVHNGLRVSNLQQFQFGLRLLFQRDRAKDLKATFHFDFRGEEQRQLTIRISGTSLEIEEGLQGMADVRVTADSATWLSYLARETSMAWAVVRGKIRIRGPIRLMLAFGRCFPS